MKSVLRNLPKLKVLFSVFALVLLLPAASWAQSVEQALTNMMNPRGLELATRTNLYRHLSDTASTRYAKCLRPGAFVVIRKVYPRWLAVCRAKSAIQFSADTTTYYMPKAAMKGAKTFILL